MFKAGSRFQLKDGIKSPFECYTSKDGWASDALESEDDEERVDDNNMDLRDEQLKDKMRKTTPDSANKTHVKTEAQQESPRLIKNKKSSPMLAYPRSNKSERPPQKERRGGLPGGELSAEPVPKIEPKAEPVETGFVKKRTRRSELERLIDNKTIIVPDGTPRRRSARPNNG